MEEEYIFLFLWLDLRILIFNCKIRKYADYVYKVYTAREVTISMAARERRPLQQRNEHAKDKKILHHFTKRLQY